MNTVERLVRHARITRQNYRTLPSPPFLILFINSICNQKCEHCFYWRNLNRKDDLTTEEIFALSRSLGRIENLNLSGGEPFLRPEFGEAPAKPLPEDANGAGDDSGFPAQIEEVFIVRFHGGRLRDFQRGRYARRSARA